MDPIHPTPPANGHPPTSASRIPGDRSDSPRAESSTQAPASQSTASLLGRELGGDLLCISCGYNLRGLSIRGSCPECGIGIRATILGIVDPLASELRPIHRPRCVAFGLVAWSLASAIGATIAWFPHLYDILRTLGVIPSTGFPRPDVGGWLLVCVALAGLGTAGLIRPHTGIPRWIVLTSIFAVLLYPLLAWLIFAIGTEQAMIGGWRYASMRWAPNLQSALLGIALNLTVCIILLLMRPTVRLLVARSLVMRSGRVDRQTMFAMAAAAGMAALGHAFGFLGGPDGPLGAATGETALANGTRIVGLVLVTLGSLLLTVGLWGGVADTVRIARSVLMPSPTIREVIRHGYSPKSGVFTRRDTDPSHTPRTSPSAESEDAL